MALISDSTAADRRKDLLVVGISYASFVILGMPSALLGVAWPYMRDQFELPQDAVGALLATVSITYFLASFISGKLVTRYGIIYPLIASGALAALGMLGYILSPSWPLIVMFGLVVGFGGGLLDAGMNILFAANYGAKWMNWLHASFGLGSMLGPLMMTWVIKSGASWIIGYGVIITALILLTAAFVLTRGHWSIAQAGSATVSSGGASARSTLRLPIVWLCVGLFFAYAGLESSAGQWSFPLFSESRGVAPDLAALWVSIYWGSFTVGRIFFGFIVNRFKTITMIRVCLAGMLAGGVIYWWSPAPEIGFVGLALFGFTLAPIFALLVTYTQERLGPHHAPNAIGFEIAAASVGVGTLPGLAGFLAARSGLGIVPPFILVFSVFMVVMYELMISPRVIVQAAPAAAGD